MEVVVVLSMTDIQVYAHLEGYVEEYYYGVLPLYLSTQVRRVLLHGVLRVLLPLYGGT